MDDKIDVFDEKKVIDRRESGVFLLISPKYGESAVVVKEGDRVSYVVTSFGVGLSELKRLQRYTDAQVYRLNGIVDLSHINWEILREMEKEAKSPIPILLVASNRFFTFEAIVKDGNLLDITAYFDKHVITGFTALRLLVSSEVEEIDKYETNMPDVVKLDVPVKDILHVLRIAPEKTTSGAPLKGESKDVRSSFIRLINGLSIKRSSWEDFIDYLSERKFSGAASSSEGDLVIFRSGEVVEREYLKLDYESEYFRVWAIQFSSEYRILNNSIQIGFVELYLPHFLSRMETESIDAEFFLFAGFDYDPSLISEILIRWHRAFVSFFDALDMVDLSGMDWIVVNTRRVKVRNGHVMPYLDRIIFIGDPGIPQAPWVLEEPLNREELSQILAKISSKDEKRLRLLTCSEVKTLLERLKKHVITWPVEFAKIRLLTGIDPERLETCSHEDLHKLKKFLKEHYGI